MGAHTTTIRDATAADLPRIFAITAVVACAGFLFWFVILTGPAPTMAPR